MAYDPMNEESPDLELPERLHRDLRGAFGATPELPAGFDERVLAATRHARQRHIANRWRILIPLTSAAAACLAVAVWMAAPRSQPPLVQSNPPAPLRNDLNGDGRVDVLDAYLLAKHVDRREAVASDWDINGDGRVDHGDAERLVASAVQLDRVPS